METTPKGLIIIKHEFFHAISNDDCINALPEAWGKLDRQFVPVAPKSLRLNELYDAPQVQIALTQRKYFIETIEPKLREYPEYKILYFGLAPIPLAIDLGQQFHNFRDIEIFQWHHVHKVWYQTIDHEPTSVFDIQTLNVPDQKQKGLTNLLLRFSISHRVKPVDTQDILENAAEIDLALTEPDEDAISNKEKMLQIGEDFKRVLDKIAGNESSLEVVHLFASIPTGLAFFIGTKISPNIHPYVQTYQYSATEKVKYTKSVLIKGIIEDNIKITDEQRAIALQLRTLSQDELQTNVKNFLKLNVTDSRGRAWYLGIMPDLADGIMSDRFWQGLPPISNSSLIDDSFDFEQTAINDGFYWKNNKWFVDDSFFIALHNRLQDEEKIKKAIRLFIFHEALHYGKHRLTTANSTDIGSFPKVLETADYQADTYGVMNEYGYSSKAIEIRDVKTFFLDSIDVATETMWSFDDRGINLEEIQIRRLNRYLIWYWQYVRIEKEGKTLDSIIRILEEKPVIEINGLKTKELNNRFFYDLNRKNAAHFEIALFKDNLVSRHGSSSPIPIESLIEGIKKMNGDLIKEVLRGLRDSQ
jgi:hypothetical protein